MNVAPCSLGQRLCHIGIWLVILWSLPAAPRLWSHTELIAADPAPGAQLAKPPREIRLTFTEPNDPLSRISLFAPGFQSIPYVKAQVNPSVPEQLVASLPPLEPNIYTVQWMAVSADKHVISGSYTFGVSQPEGRVWSAAVVALAAIALLLFGLWRLGVWRRFQQRQKAQRAKSVHKIDA